MAEATGGTATPGSAEDVVVGAGAAAAGGVSGIGGKPRCS